MSQYHEAVRWSSKSKKARAYWSPMVQRGIVCHFCSDLIRPGQPWAVDHVVPLSHGGSVGVENQAPVHRSCNGRAAQSITRQIRARFVRLP